MFITRSVLDEVESFFQMSIGLNMGNFLLDLGVSEGIIKTIQWWSPALEGLL